MTDIPAILKLLSEHGVEFIVVGGVAATLHGSARFTQDVDVVYRRTPENLTRLEKCWRRTHRTSGGLRRGCRFAGTPRPFVEA